MKRQQALRIIGWAETLANLYDIGIQNIISRFIDTNNRLKDIKIAQETVEQELQTEYASLINEVRQYDITIRPNKNGDKAKCEVK